MATSLEKVPPPAWDALVDANDPFLEHAFLWGLERTDCVGSAQTGWLPRHVLAWRGSQLVGAMPLYLKTDSYGEYIFDWGWASAAAQARIPYYPKLVSAVPFTPATGHRLLLAADENHEEIAAALMSTVLEVAEEESASSVHVLFLRQQELSYMVPHGLMPRLSYQFKWRRQSDWQHHEDYLASMRSSARKRMRKERRIAQSHGLSITMLPGQALEDSHWRALYRAYRTTVERKGAIPYLSGAFFRHLREHQAHRVVASFAGPPSAPVAAALYLTKGKHLYGRYWGAEQEIDAMHFELCYHQPIDWCLERGLDLFEAGAQGSHKLKRGLLPELCHSAHWLRHPELRRAISEYLPREATAVTREIAWLSGHSPFRSEAPE